MGISYGDGRWFDNEYEAVADSHRVASDFHELYSPQTSTPLSDINPDKNKPISSKDQRWIIDQSRDYQDIPGRKLQPDAPLGPENEITPHGNQIVSSDPNYPIKYGPIQSEREPLRLTVTPNIDETQPALTEPKDIHIIRHGTTEENEEDKIRGTNDDVKLSDEGRKHALDAAEELRGKGIEALVTSPLARAKETSQIIGKELGIPITVSDKLKTWNVGDFEGKPCEGNNDTLQNYAEKKPDEVVPGGESYNQFKDRAFEGIRKAILANKDKKLGIVTHHMVESSLEGWEKTGQDNPSLDLSKLFEDTNQPGSVRKMTMQPDSTIMQPDDDDRDPFEMAAMRQRETVKPGGMSLADYSEHTGHNVRNYAGYRKKGKATVYGEAIATSPFRVIGNALLRGSQNLMEALKTISDRGHEGSLTDEEIESISPKLFEFINLLNGPARPIPNTLGMFVAPSLGKKLYAEGLRKSGRSPEEVKALTGVEHGAEGMLREEISDLPSKVVNTELLKSLTLPLEWVFDHPELYKVYPELKDVKIFYNPKLPETTDARFMSVDNEIQLNPSLTDPMDIHDAILHEVQHWIQNKEGFAFNVPSDAPESFVKAFGTRMRKEGVTESPKERIYRQLASEVEARNTQKRAGMTELERRTSLAKETEDIKRSYQLIFDEKGNRIDASMSKNPSMAKDTDFTIKKRKELESDAAFEAMAAKTKASLTKKRKENPRFRFRGEAPDWFKEEMKQ